MVIQIEPWINEEELEELKKVIDSTFITEWKKTEEFENKFKEITGAKNTYAYCNGTMGLFAALKILGIGEGDEVIVPDLTFIASANTIILAGAKPIFVDVNEEDFQINTREIENNITEKTKAIMPVHLYGQSCDMDKIMKIARKYNLKVIEDAAQSVGVKFEGKHVGTFGDIGCLSFYGNKTITTGEGGMLLTNDDELAKKAFYFKNHGRNKKGIFIHDYIGYNFSFTDLQAAIGLSQLNKLEKIKKRKKEISDFYFESLKDIEEIKFPRIDDRCEPVFWFTNIIVPDAETLEEYLKGKNIQTRRFFYPLHKQPCYSYMKLNMEFPNADYLYKHGLSLPSSFIIKDDELKEVVEKIRKFFRK